jgi:hypothetical protein
MSDFVTVSSVEVRSAPSGINWKAESRGFPFEVIKGWMLVRPQLG